MAADPPADVAQLLAPYLGAVAAANGGAPGERLLLYPGSPWIVRHLMRAGDRLTAVELHPADHRALAQEFAGDGAVRVIRLDGWLALGGQVPPKERRGLVLVDPPFEEGADWDRLVDGLVKAHRRWPGGVYALWYPVTAGAPVKALKARLAASGVPRVMAAELSVRAAAEEGLLGSGLVVVNPPFVLRGELSVLLPWLALVMGEGAGRSRVETLAGEEEGRPP
jgi:23S rRNA (adenine2030-N6)-methyltransferase